MQPPDQLGVLRLIFQKQIELNKIIGYDLFTIRDNTYMCEGYTKEYILAAVDELFEVLHEINWKVWKKQRKQINIDKIREELIDVFHFLINLFILWGITPEMLEELYLKKNAENQKRQNEGY